MKEFNGMMNFDMFKEYLMNDNVIWYDRCMYINVCFICVIIFHIIELLYLYFYYFINSSNSSIVIVVIIPTSINFLYPCSIVLILANILVLFRLTEYIL